ncbi:MAG: hypothetical protein WCK93_12400 [Nitrosomonadales bacterium]
MKAATRIIGLAGPRGSGKGTVYNILQAKHGALEFAFATPLKTALCCVLGKDIAWLECNKDKIVSLHGQDLDLRQLMLDAGDFWRARDDGVFVNRLVDQVLKRVQDSPGAIIVITDVRRPPEADAVRQMKGEMWHIRRHGTGQGPHDDHEVEHYFDDLIQIGDRFIQNGTLEVLAANVDAAFARSANVDTVFSRLDATA